MKHCKSLIRLGLLALALPASLGAQTAAQSATPAVSADGAAAEIDRDTIEGPVRFLADDLLEGRGPASRGDELTQLYLATTLEMLGYEPGGEKGSYLQPFDIVGIDSKPPQAWEFTKGGQKVSLKNFDQFIAASGVQKDRSVIQNAELVFVG